MIENNSTQNAHESPFSLINYEAEIQISDNIQQYQKAKHAAKKLDPNPSPQDVLNNMIPPRDWRTSENKYFMQYVSHSKSSRDDVFTLKQNLQQVLQDRQARKQGICPIRSQLFSQAFDQIIRQVTINCPERGILLMRVRDEHIMTLSAYQTLYHSSMGYGMKKQLQAQEGMQELSQAVQAESQRFNQLNQKRIQLQGKKESLQKKLQERLGITTAQNEHQFDMINEQARQLQIFLDSVRKDQPIINKVDLSVKNED